MEEGKLIKVGIGAFVTLAILVVAGFWFFEKIDNGNVGIRYSMSDEVVLAKLKEAKIPKAQRDIFIPWFRRAESKSK